MAAAEGIVVEAVEDLYQQIQSLSSEALEPVIQKSEDGVRATLGNDVPFIFNASSGSSVGSPSSAVR